jgi:hypothetical protein
MGVIFFFFRVHCCIDIAGGPTAYRMCHVYPVFLRRCNTKMVMHFLSWSFSLNKFSLF